MKVLYLFLSLCGGTLGAPCIPSDPTFNYYTKEDFTYVTLNSIQIIMSKYMTTTGNLYLYGTASDTSNKYLYLRKQSMDENIYWDTFINETDYTYFGFDVAPDESYIYAIPLEADFYIYIIDASNGNYFNGK